jgi:hypothetical protein
MTDKYLIAEKAYKNNSLQKITNLKSLYYLMPKFNVANSWWSSLLLSANFALLRPRQRR